MCCEDICQGGDSRDWCIVRLYVREVTPVIGVLRGYMLGR